MAGKDNVLSGASLLELGLEELTKSPAVRTRAQAGKDLVDRLGETIRRQREEREQEERERVTQDAQAQSGEGRDVPLSQRYDYRFSDRQTPNCDGGYSR